MCLVVDKSSPIKEVARSIGPVCNGSTDNDLGSGDIQGSSELTALLRVLCSDLLREDPAGLGDARVEEDTTDLLKETKIGPLV